MVARTTEDILAHPDFPVARAIYVEEHLKVYEMGVLPGQFGADAGRVTALAILVCLHAGYVESDRETWPTLKRLKDAVAGFGFASPRLIDDFVARLVQTGHLEQHRHAADSRVRLLVPTEPLLAWDREWMAAHFAPLDALFPEPGYAFARDRSARFQKAHGAASIAVLDGAVKVAWASLDVVFFLAASGGLSILLTLCRMGAENPDSTVREADISDRAPRFGVSRSHIRNMLVAAEERGFVRFGGKRGQFIQLTPRWVSAFDRFMADSLAYSDLTYRRGVAAMAAE